MATTTANEGQTANGKSGAGASPPLVFSDIIIPTKGRADSKRATWHLLAAGKIPFTLVVEPQDAQGYADLLQGLNTPGARMAVLPKNNQGVSYARNLILSKYAPSEGWFWIMDDDIQRFGRAVNKKVIDVTASWILREVARRMSLCVEQHKHLGVFALEYSQFSFSYDDDAISTNSYANIAICINKQRMPRGIRYRLRVREDYDFALQMIRAGYSIVRFRNLSFTVPQMGTKQGGMTNYYSQQKPDIRKQNQLFLEAWGAVAEEVQKGTGPTLRYDIRVKWSMLNDRKAAMALLKAIKFKGFSTDPLTTPQPAAASSSSPSTTAGSKRQRTEASAEPAAPVVATGGLLQSQAKPSQPSPPPPPKEPQRKGWKGYAEVKYRVVNIDIASRHGLEAVKAKTGAKVVFIPTDITRPVLMDATVVDASARSWTLIPDRRGEPLCHVSLVFRPPANRQEVEASIRQFYHDEDIALFGGNGSQKDESEVALN